MEFTTISEMYSIEKIYGKKKLNGYTNDKGKYIEGWIERYPILKTPIVQRWLENSIYQFAQRGKDPKKFTLTSKLNQLSRYCEFYGVKNPKELLKTDVDQRNFDLSNFMLFLENGALEELKKLGYKSRPLESSRQNSIQGSIRSFYSDRGFPITLSANTVQVGSKTDEMILLRDDVRVIEKGFMSPNYKLISKFQSQLGLRISDVLDEITAESENDTPKYKIKKYNNHYYIPKFMTQKEKVLINFLFFSSELTDSIYITTGKKDLEDLDLRTLFMTNRNTRIKSRDYLESLRNIGVKAKFEGRLRTHSFRKYFASQLDKVKEINPKFLEHLLGHKVAYTDKVYIRNLERVDFFFKQWKDVEPLICVDCVIFDNTMEDIKTLKKQREEDLRENLRLKEQIELIQNDYKGLMEDFNTEHVENRNRIADLMEVVKGLDGTIKRFEEKLKTK